MAMAYAGMGIVFIPTSKKNKNIVKFTGHQAEYLEENCNITEMRQHLEKAPLIPPNKKKKP